MNERFKFRAWNIRDKFMLDIFDPDHEDWFLPKWSSRWIPMQCTGFPDKQGTFIFEGDICKDTAGTITQIVWSGNHCWSCYIIKGGTLAEKLIFPLWQWDRCDKNGYRELEVIGNIYENPELLEVI